MPLVTVTYKAWDHNREVIPASAQPRVGFRPLSTSFAGALMSDREIWGSLNTTTGSGSVELESSAELLYVPFMDWLIDDGADEPTNRAREFCEWDPFFPGPGGPIDQLPGKGNALSGTWYGLGDPPQVLRRRDDVTYWDISGVPNGKPWLWIDQRFLIGGGA